MLLFTPTSKNSEKLREREGDQIGKRKGGGNKKDLSLFP
jgi:hypothetical protein